MSKYFKSGTYTKGEKTRNVQTATDAAQAIWDGFKAPDADAEQELPPVPSDPPSLADGASRPTEPAQSGLPTPPKPTGDDEA